MTLCFKSKDSHWYDVTRKIKSQRLAATLKE
uniref:Uncharacterized protein n=1 Tax=Anguilla anguilla TaxID=7936 RepID=A0A0E9VP67_ANGAN